MRIILILISILFCLNLKGQEEKNSMFSYEIAHFYNFRAGAISFTFDDGFSKQFDDGLKILDSNDFKATFFIPIYAIGDNWELLNEMVNKGYEIGSHTLSHPKLTEITSKEIIFEVEQSKKIIELNIKNYQCFSFAYPHGRFNNSIKKIISLNYQAARSVETGLCSPLGSDYLELKTFFFNSKTKLKTANNWVNSAIHDNKWLVESYHSFDGDGYQPISSNLFRKHLEYIKSKENYLWVATLQDVVKYFKERQGATISLIDSLDYLYRIQLNDNLPDSIYNHPLTLKIKIPKSWRDISIRHGEHIVQFQTLVDPLGNQYVIFDAVPDRGLITVLSKTPFDSELEKCENCNLILYPIPFNNSFRVLWNPMYVGNFSILNLKGQMVFKGELKSGILQIDTELLEKGNYMVVFDLETEKGNFHLIKKVVKE